MANPQIEDGYIRISTELFEALCKIRVPGEARQIFDFIMRKTYGFNKKEDAISLSQFFLGTGISKTHVCDSIKKLLKMNLVTEKGNDIANVYSINKDYTTWKPLPKKGTFPKNGISIPEKRNKSFHLSGTTIDNIQKTITKDIALPVIISSEDWNRWVEHRKKQKKPMSEYAKELAIKKLVRLHKEGYKPGDVIAASIENNWQGLFPSNSKPKSDQKFYAELF